MIVPRRDFQIKKVLMLKESNNEKNKTEELLILDPIHYIPIGIFFIIAALLLYLGIKTYRNYLENRSKRVQYFGIGILVLGLASFFAGLEKTFLILDLSSSFVLSVNFLQVLCNSIGYLAINLFCLHVVIPKYEKKIFGLNVILSSIDISLYVIFPPTFVPKSYELILPSSTMLSQIVFGIPIILMIPILLFYYAFTMRKQSPPHSKWSFWLGMATMLIFFALYLKMFLPSDFADFTRLLWIPAFLFWYICFTRFIEVDWPKKIRSLFLIFGDSGVCIFDHSFRAEEVLEKQLIGGTISGITGLIQEVTRSKQKLQLMDQGETKILLEYGTYIIGVLITEENFYILRKKLKRLVEEFELKYEETLQNFTGSLDEFGATKELVNDIFSYKELIDRTIFH
ncbi:MAG: hypothetical protein HWN65_21800 [Candidatus Helarchaeota archaeon]|nr:hypothetical protein [Candidatus Helarchaeota archaeon]